MTPEHRYRRQLLVFRFGLPAALVYPPSANREYRVRLRDLQPHQDQDKTLQGPFLLATARPKPGQCNEDPSQSLKPDESTPSSTIDPKYRGNSIYEWERREHEAAIEAKLDFARIS